MEHHRATTATFDQALPGARAREGRERDARQHGPHARDTLARQAHAVGVSADGVPLVHGARADWLDPDAGRPSPIGPVGADDDVQRAMEQHTNRMLVANGLYLVGGALLVAIGQLAYGYCLLGFACVAGAIVVQHRARKELRGTLVRRALAKGASPAAARAEADAKLDALLR